MRHLLRPPFRVMAVIALSILLAFGLGLPASMVAAESSNEETINQTEAALPGEESASGGGMANSGTANTLDTAHVNQVSVQVAAGNDDAIANSSQTATNTTTVDQTTVAQAGDATATNGGTASTGHAFASSTAIVMQLNVQVMALLSEDCVVTQVASNDAQIDQTSVAASGDATSDGSGNASSGNAHARSRSHLVQRNIQVYVCKDNGDLTAEQLAANAYSSTQTSAAITGNAGASSGGDAATGDADASSTDFSRQTNRQIGR